MDDALTGLLDLAAVRGVLGARIAAGEDWGWWSPATPGAAFHAVTEGQAWLARPGAEPIALLPGDVLLLPGGAEHALASDPDALARTSPERSGPYTIADDGTVLIGRGASPDTPRTRILCAHYEHDPSASAPVLGLLPDVIHLHADPCGSAALSGTVALLAAELATPQPAGPLVLGRLVEVLLVQVLRAWLAHAEAHDGDAVPPSPLRALRDPVVAAAMAHIHAAPQHPWTTDALGRATAVSRATLARRFPAAVGETPAGYLTRRRMDLAARRLRDTDDALERIARDVGYTSVYAFSRAFRRARGVPPGRYRTQARAAAARVTAPAAA